MNPNINEGVSNLNKTTGQRLQQQQENSIKQLLKAFQDKQQMFDLSYPEIISTLINNYYNANNDQKTKQENVQLKQQVQNLSNDKNQMQCHYEVQFQQQKEQIGQQQTYLNQLKQDTLNQEQTITSLQNNQNNSFKPYQNMTQESLQHQLQSSHVVIDSLQVEKKKDQQELNNLKQKLDSSLQQIKMLFKTVQGLGVTLKGIKTGNGSANTTSVQPQHSQQQLTETIQDTQNQQKTYIQTVQQGQTEQLQKQIQQQLSDPRDQYQQYYHRFGVSSINIQEEDREIKMSRSRSQNQNQSLQERFNKRITVQREDNQIFM